MKKLTLTAGKKPDEKNQELNEQLKGLAARVAQNENLTAGLHHSTSKLRENLEGVLPTLIPINAATKVTQSLNKLPSGLDAMVEDVQSKAQAYLQKTVEQALAKFLTPNLAELQSLLPAGLEGAVQGAQAEIADLIAKNPVVETVDALTSELADLKASEAAPSVIAAGTTRLQGEIARLTAANPAVGAVTALRAELGRLVETAGPGLHFLEPQKRLVQGMTKSLRLGGPG